jgi:predicted transcriptional regulator/ribosome-associated translation inhibitor RaiA
VKVDSLTEENYDTYSPELSVNQIKDKLLNGRSKAFLLKSGSDITGITTHRTLCDASLKKEDALSLYTRPAPEINVDEGIRSAVNYLVEAQTPLAPVHDGRNAVGTLSKRSILSQFKDNFAVLDVKDIYTQYMFNTNPDSSVDKAIDKLNKYDISRLPVTDDSDGLVGIVTTTDVIIEQLSNKVNRQVSDVMSSSVECISQDSRVDTAASKMLTNNYGGLLVVEDNKPVGVLTMTDVLRSLTYEKPQNMKIQITNIDKLSDYSKEHLSERITEVTNLYSDLELQHAHVKLQEHSEKRNGRSLIRCQIRLQTDKGQVAGTAEEFGSANSFDEASNILEKNLIELKERNLNR